jgi:heme oxygenase
MTTLKESTSEQHHQAEQHPFTQLLLSGKMSEAIYADFLYNQQAIYYSLEAVAKRRGVLNGLDGLERTMKIGDDFDNLKIEKTKLYPSTLRYINYITNRNLTAEQLLAHIYVRHMGDLYGGQMIKKVVPGNSTMYDFENRSELITALRAKLNPSMGTEANECFAYAIELFTELANEHNIQ